MEMHDFSISFQNRLHQLKPSRFFYCRCNRWQYDLFHLSIECHCHTKKSLLHFRSIITTSGAFNEKVVTDFNFSTGFYDRSTIHNIGVIVNR
jgi:hypothetical protein